MLLCQIHISRTIEAKSFYIFVDAVMLSHKSSKSVNIYYMFPGPKGFLYIRSLAREGIIADIGIALFSDSCR